MTGFVARSSICAAVAAIALTGCQGPPPTGVPPTPAPTASFAPSVTTTPTPLPTQAAGDCPNPLPIDIAGIVALDEPSCYGSTELTLHGWLAENMIGVETGETAPSWTMSQSSIYPDRPTVRQYVFDFLLAEHSFGIRVVAPPDADIDLFSGGTDVILRGHFNDPVASACTFVDPEQEESGADARCEELFVVTSLQQTHRPAPDCPTDSPLTLTAFLDASAMCFIGREVQLTGWEDVGEGFGGVSTAYPIVLDPSLELAHAQLVSNRWEWTEDREVIFPWTVRGSGIGFDRSDTRVVVTGQLGHPAAEGCRPGEQGWTWEPSIAWAQERCRHLFVITEVRNRD